MPMGTVTATNALTHSVEKPKYFEIGTITETYLAALTTALASGDIIIGPTVPANTYLLDVAVDIDRLDTGAAPTLAFEVGYTPGGATFIANGNATGRTGGLQRMNVAGSLGFTSTTDYQVRMTITATAQTPAAGNVRIQAQYTANP